MDHGALVVTEDNSGLTSLMLASRNGHLEIINLLLDRFALVEAKSNKGWTALMYASQDKAEAEDEESLEITNENCSAVFVFFFSLGPMIQKQFYDFLTRHIWRL